MATRRDQLQSYQFMVQRVISAFVMRETDPAQSPLRRGVGAVFAGVMITVMVAVGFGVAGILTKVGSTNWKSDGSVVIEKETGASYVYVSGQLHPTLNYASALLASGKPKPTVARVSAKSLAGVPRGVTIGIAGAPDSLPGPKERIGLPWSICVRPEPNAAGRTVSTTTLAVGTTPSGASALGDQALLVRNEGEEEATYLVWHGRRYLIERPRSMVPAIFGALATATPVGTAWLSTIPSGLDIKPITIDDRGKPSSKVKGRPIGQVLIAGPSRYLVLDDGLAPLTPLQEAVLGSQFNVRRVEVGVAETTGFPRSSRLNPTNTPLAPPELPPVLSTAVATDMLCATTDNAGTPPQVTSGGTLAGIENVPTTVRTRDGVRLADKVLVPSGRVAVIRVTGAPDAPAGTYHVVTDTGLRYAIPAPAVLQMLGYGPEQAIDVPSTLAIRIPAGPALDPQDAIKTATAGGAN